MSTKSNQQAVLARLSALCSSDVLFIKRRAASLLMLLDKFLMPIQAAVAVRGSELREASKSVSRAPSLIKIFALLSPPCDKSIKHFTARYRHSSSKLVDICFMHCDKHYPRAVSGGRTGQLTTIARHSPPTVRLAWSPLAQAHGWLHPPPARTNKAQRFAVTPGPLGSW